MQYRQKDLAGYRVQKLAEQNGLCPLCNQVVVKPVADHAHLNEPHEHHLRAVICSQCNTCLGSVWKVLVRSGQVNKLGIDGAVKFLQNAGAYYATDYSTEPYHPNRPKDEEKRLNRCTKTEILNEFQYLNDELYKGCNKADLIKIIVSRM
ncbi:endonuclease domain-containing protein [Aeromonas hydrophila]|uniref:endonuclease domain-containing protein n=1 Tax=Aeromonas hydrophila TaxID=644 RepID=UPI00366CF6D3